MLQLTRPPTQCFCAFAAAVGTFPEPDPSSDDPGVRGALAVDLRFMFRHAAWGGLLKRVNHVLVDYRHTG